VKRLLLACLTVFALAALAALSEAVACGDVIQEAGPRVALHAARLSGDSVVWTSTLLGNTVDAGSARATMRVPLARPIDAELVAPSPGISSILDGRGAIVAYAIDGARLPGWPARVQVTLRAKLAREGDDVVLAPPLVRGELVQRVDVTAGSGATFEPSADLRLERQLGSWSTEGVGERVRQNAAAELAADGEAPGDVTLYVRSESPKLARGLRGRALTAEERARPGLLLALATFAILVAALLLVRRWLSGMVRIERAEAFLRTEYERSEP
jgi:hypothetical protein